MSIFETLLSSLEGDVFAALPHIVDAKGRWAQALLGTVETGAVQVAVQEAGKLKLPDAMVNEVSAKTGISTETLAHAETLADSLLAQLLSHSDAVPAASPATAVEMGVVSPDSLGETPAEAADPAASAPVTEAEQVAEQQVETPE